jgi:curved DNA-binding protein
MKPTICYYKLLNVSAKADVKEIKSQYYNLAKKHHPDVVAGRTTSEKEIQASDKLFKEVTEAYAILSDEKLRKKYDRLIYGDSADNREF